MVYILFVIGFVILVKGADILVDGASSIAKRYNISDFIIGLTIVSIGTSMPELLVNIMAGIQGKSEIGVGNVLGSNVANILLVLGLSACINQLPIKRNTLFIEIPFSLTATLLVGYFANVSIFSESKVGLSLDLTEGIILLFFFALFLGYIYNYAKEKHDDVIEGTINTQPIVKSIAFIIIGIIGLFLGGKWVVDGAIELSKLFGLSESFIGLTLVALGTSLPELVTSVVAVYRKKTQLAVGNVIGSNIFNLLWILGISSIITPIEFETVNNSDIMMIIISSSLLILSIIVGKRSVITRYEGVVFLLVYAGYIYHLFLRG
ncbi:calcium/sodium antiporter [Marinigracilibium pacificum]|uniref:Calcium/sodium antiporter n=1 Tax=Marinigracilibium pacificum TaxID=2729599 RepID=A0A848J6W1_9BACT|nr:calcium/sodium antiporter [Marinigracilibium pacificum]NMM50250.1 calcium/sodium antiporter [Marinigracilibium pacificum]